MSWRRANPPRRLSFPQGNLLRAARIQRGMTLADVAFHDGLWTTQDVWAVEEAAMPGPFVIRRYHRALSGDPHRGGD